MRLEKAGFGEAAPSGFDSVKADFLSWELPREEPFEDCGTDDLINFSQFLNLKLYLNL